MGNVCPSHTNLGASSPTLGARHATGAGIYPFYIPNPPITVPIIPGGSIGSIGLSMGTRLRDPGVGVWGRKQRGSTASSPVPSEVLPPPPPPLLSLGFLVQGRIGCSRGSVRFPLFPSGPFPPIPVFGLYNSGLGLVS